MRLAVLLFLASSPAFAQQAAVPSVLPDAPSQTLITTAPEVSSSVSASDLYSFSMYPAGYEPQQQDAAQAAKQTDPPKKKVNPLIGADFDKDGNPIPLERQQPKRILGFMPNYRTVSAGAKVPDPGWKYNFGVARRQALDYSSFIFLGLTSLSAEALNEHPSLGKGADGFYAYTWRGFIDKTDGTFLSAFLLPSLLHEDTRYYPLGAGHKIVTRALYVISRQAVARTYGGRQTPNIAGLGGKVLTQYISRNYYPAGASDFGTLAEKFGYSVMRDVIFSSIREFYPDIAAHYIKKHRQKVARQANLDAVTH